MVYRSRRLLNFSEGLAVAEGEAALKVQAARNVQRTVRKTFLNVMPVLLSFGRNYLFGLLGLANKRFTMPSCIS